MITRKGSGNVFKSWSVTRSKARLPTSSLVAVIKATLFVSTTLEIVSDF